MGLRSVGPPSIRKLRIASVRFVLRVELVSGPRTLACRTVVAYWVTFVFIFPCPLPASLLPVGLSRDQFVDRSIACFFLSLCVFVACVEEHVLKVR